MPRLSPLSFAALLLIATSARAQTVVYAKDGTRASVQAAVDSLAGPGVVVLPVGQFELVGSVLVSTDDVTIIGAGAGKTVLFRNAPPSGADAATFAQYTAPFLQAKGAGRPRFSSLGIRSWKAVTGLDDRDLGIAISACPDFRVDHCSFRFTGNSGVTTSGETTGVVDHCEFSAIYEDPIGNFGYGVSVYGTKVLTGEPFGTSRATFIEDSSFDGCRHAVASNGGARYVFRHNHVTGNVVSHAVDAHGAEYPPSPKPDCSPCYTPAPDNPGTEWAEVYGNRLEKPTYVTAAVRLRGGKGLIFDNTIRDYELAVSLTKTTPEHTGPVHIWDNALQAGTTLVQGSGTCCGESASWKLSALAGYKPHAYPHPLVTDLDVAAGPDLRVMAPAPGAPARVYVDGTGTKASKGSIVGYRWHDSTGVVSECARDLLELAQGTHVLLLSARRDDGLSDVDTLVVEVVPSGPLTSSPSWRDLWFAPWPGKGTIRFTVTPKTAPTDAYVGFTGRHAVAAHDDHAMQVRANNQGYFDVRNGDAYASQASVPYQAGQSYPVQIDFDVVAQTYDVSVQGTVIAEGYAFRRSEKTIEQMTAWSANTTDVLQVENLELDGTQLGPEPACADAPDAGSDASLGSDGSGPDAQGDSDAQPHGHDSGSMGGSSSVDASLASDSGTSVSASADDGGGCGCSIPGRSGVPWWLVAVGAAAMVLRRRARQGDVSHARSRAALVDCSVGAGPGRQRAPT